MNLFEEIREIISWELKIPSKRITPGSLLLEDLSMDFIDMVKLAMELETRYNIEISDEEVEQFATVNELVDHIRKKLCAAKGDSS